MQQREEFWNDTFHVVGHIDLVAIELDLVLLELQTRLHFREVKDAGQIEWIVNVQMYPEQGLVAHWIEVAVELLVVLVLQF